MTTTRKTPTPKSAKTATGEVWAECRYCLRERRLVDGIVVDHNAWNGREMTWCPGSGFAPAEESGGTG